MTPSGARGSARATPTWRRTACGRRCTCCQTRVAARRRRPVPTVARSRVGKRCPTVREWMLRVDSIGKVHGAGGISRSRAPGRNTAPPSARPRVPSSRPGTSRSTSHPGEALGVIGESGFGEVDCAVVHHRRRARHRRFGAPATVDGGRTDLLALPDAQRRRLRVDGMAVVHQNAADGLDLRVSAGGNIAERLTAAGWRGTTTSATGRPNCSTGSRCRCRGWTIRSARSPAACASACRSPRRWPPSRRWCFSTSRPRVSTRRWPPGCSTCCAVCFPNATSPQSSVSHDFSVIESLTDRTIVMHLGRVVERGPDRPALPRPAPSLHPAAVAAGQEVIAVAPWCPIGSRAAQVVHVAHHRRPHRAVAARHRSRRRGRRARGAGRAQRRGQVVAAALHLPDLPAGRGFRHVAPADGGRSSSPSCPTGRWPGSGAANSVTCHSS